MSGLEQMLQGIDPDLIGAAIALGSVILIDIVLASDNALVIGLAAAGLPSAQRRKAISIGLFVAVIVRIIFVLLAVQLLRITGLMLIGGVFLVWVAWRTFIDLINHNAHAPTDAIEMARAGLEDVTGQKLTETEASDGVAATVKPKSLWRAILTILIADISMSIDNVLAVSGAAHDHILALVIVLLLSIGLMGVAAHVISRLIDKARWIGLIGVVVILIVAGHMIWDGSWEIIKVAHCSLSKGWPDTNCPAQVMDWLKSTLPLKTHP